MDANGEFVLSIATANPGVLVKAPAINPTTLGVSISNAYFKPTAVRQAEQIMSIVMRISVFTLTTERIEKLRDQPEYRW